MSARRAARRRLREERGYTLMEVVVATGCGLVVVAAVLAALTSALHLSNASANRMSAVQTLQEALGRVTSELRPAASVAYVSGHGNLAVVVTPPGAGATPVTYDCYTTASTCARAVSGSTTLVLATGVQNSDVFTLECRSAAGDRLAVSNGGSLAGCVHGLDYVAVRLVVSVSCSGQQSIGSCPNGTTEIDGGTSLRNQQ
jgi:type II secretory pathway pseudopilin PulG